MMNPFPALNQVLQGTTKWVRNIEGPHSDLGGIVGGKIIGKLNAGITNQRF